MQSGLRAIVLGSNLALASAVQNDFAVDRLGFAQELTALARPGEDMVESAHGRGAAPFAAELGDRSLTGL